MRSTRRVWFILLPLFILVFGIGETGAEEQSSGCGGSDDANNIESKYADSGSYPTTTTQVPGYVIYHPSEMTGNHPIITWGNGSGMTPDKYNDLLSHLASWGFVVIASESINTGSGREMIQGIDYLIEQNSERGSTFYGMIDTEHIGVAGHSEGGVGTIFAARDPRVTCSAPLAGSGLAGSVKGPMLFIAGAQDKLVRAGLVRLGFMTSQGPAIFAVAQDMNHAMFLNNGGSCRGYLTAWFMYQLQGDTAAAQAFLGDCEICNNPNWDVKKKNFDSRF